MITGEMASRAVGQYPISIPTSLAIEAALGIHPDYQVTKAPIFKYDELWVNLRTLFRNLMGSLEKDSNGKVKPQEVVDTLEEEMSYIEDIIADKTTRSVKVIFYYSNYAHLDSKYKRGVVRMDNTEKQKEMTALHNASMKILLEKNKESRAHTLHVYSLNFTKQGEIKKKALILTNYAIDLITYDHFDKLTLLESHTGKLKERAQWYTKYMPIDDHDLSQIPFNSCFLRIFGDKETFRAFQLKTRLNILEVAKKYNWSSITTKDKIIYGIKTLLNPYEKEIILDMLHN